MTEYTQLLERYREAASQVVLGLSAMQGIALDMERAVIDLLEQMAVAGVRPAPEPVEAKQEPTPAPEPEPAPQVQAEPEPTPEPAPEPVPEVTLEQARSAMVAIARTHGPDAAKKILTDLGYEKLTDVPAEKYADIMTAAEAAQ